MGAGARQRGDKVIRERIVDEERELVTVERAYLSGLYSQVDRYRNAALTAERSVKSVKAELVSAQALIARLRAENAVLKDEKKKFLFVVDSAKRHMAIAGNPHKKWAVTMVKAQLKKARLI